uniref:Glycosyltransferase n=1 Tax=Gentiana crassa subsp. rigescens TaxID=3097545 RepID=A0A2H4CCK2_9GENT|nr:UGT7 [Gentiana rigescens]
MSQNKEWVVLVPTPLQGHFTPMLQLGSLLHSKGFSILVAHPEFDTYKPPHHPDFTFLSVPYALSRSGTLSTFSFDTLRTIGTMNRDCRGGLVSLLKDEEFDGRIRCIIYDWVMNFGEAVATDLKLPSIVLRTSSAAHTLSYQVVFDLHAQNRLPLSVTQKQDLVPGHQPLRFQDLPAEVFSEIPDGVLQFFDSITNIRSSVGIIWNTTEDLEHKELNQYQQNCKVPFFNLGPLYKMAATLSSSSSTTTSFLEEDAHCIEWLDKQEPKSVIYISLGSLTSIDKQELEETASALANSGQPFLWVIRPSSIESSSWIEGLPDNFRELIGERGQIVKWAPQKKVLAHRAVGGFLSHCGWNSTLESICEAVPMICRPCFGDQIANARYITQVWGIGLELEHVQDRKAIESTIRRLMVDNEGKEIRQRVLELKLKLDASVQNDGSSYNSLNDLTDFILSR